MQSVSTLRSLALCLALASPGLMASPPSPSDIARMDAHTLEAALQSLPSPRGDGTTDAARVARGAILIRTGAHAEGLSALADVRSPEFAHAVRYFRGVAADAMGEPELASRLFESAANQDDDLAVQALADDALLALAFAPQPAERAATSRHFGLVSLGSFATNGLVDPVDADVIDATDRAAELALTGSLLAWQPGPDTSLRLTGSLYTQRYSDFDQYNLGVLNGSARLSHRTGSQVWSVAAALTDLRLGGEGFMDYRDLSLGMTQPLGTHMNVGLRLRLRDIEPSQSAFRHLDGRDVQFRLQLSGAAAPWRVEYTFGREARDDRIFADTFANGAPFEGFNSFSRDIHQFQAKFDYRWRHDFTQSFTLGARQSLHDEAEQLIADDRLLTAKRDATRFEIGTELSWQVTNRFMLKADLTRLDEDSDVAVYSYDTTQLSLGLEYLF